MGDQNGELGDLRSVAGHSAAAPPPPRTQAPVAPATTAPPAALAAPGAPAAPATLAAPGAPGAPVAPGACGASNAVEEEEKRADTYKEIANLQDINLYYPLHKLALEEWQRKEKYLSSSVSRREGRSAELTNQIYNIFGWFAVFQGVVLTAVSQLTQTASSASGGVPLCGKIWFPIVLTGFATVATIAGILQKFAILQKLEFTIHTEKQAKIEVARRASTLRREGPKKFKFHLDTSNALRPSKPERFRKNQWAVIVSLVIFTGIFILSYFVILCDTLVVRKWDGGLHR